MAEIRRLDGSEVKVERLGANPKVDELLDELRELNGRGRISALAVVYLTPEGWWESTWRWPEKRDNGFPWGLAMQGAITLLQADLSKATLDSEAMPSPDEAG